MNKMTKNTADEIPLTDPKLAAAATVEGARLERCTQDPISGRVVFHFRGLSSDFLERIFNGEMQVSLRDYLSALEHTNALIAQYRARRGR